ncbi:MAG: pyruvate kinase [Pseudomonadota bacterium]|nr:pyruvate kinase [Pseudomonadota bacterium]
MMRQRRAKILATVGPASSDPKVLRQLFAAGVDSFRLNFSHGTHADHDAVITALRALEQETGTPIAILQDLQGPKIRLGVLGGVRPVKEGQLLRLINSDTAQGDDIPLPHPEIFAALKAGDRLLVDDGRVCLVATEVTGGTITAKVVSGHALNDRKGVNLPDCVLELPCLTAKDRADLEFGLSRGVDWVALSFVQRASDLEEIGQIVQGRAGIVAKIEKPSALMQIDAIVARADAIMIARGDLGVEIPPEAVPGHQKDIIALCRRMATPVIVATQMLESMTSAAAPTRAEASDVATAVYDGADAVMLSAESAAGQYPVEAVAVMDRIIKATESHQLYLGALAASREPAVTPADTIANTGAKLACALAAQCIVAYSRSGATALRVSARRSGLPLVVLTPDPAVQRRMALVWGATALQDNSATDHSGMLKDAQQGCEALFQGAGCFVMLCGEPSGASGQTNNIRVGTFGGA